MARVEKFTEFVGVGCLVQGLALLAPWPFLLLGFAGLIVGFAVALLLFIIGSRMSAKYRCGDCKNPVASKAVKICPACKVAF